VDANPKYTTEALLLGAPFVVTSGSDKNGLTYGMLGGYNYQVGQLVLGVEGDFVGWTVGKIRYTSVTGDFLTAHSKWGVLDPRAARLRCRSRSVLCDGLLSRSVAMTRAWVGRSEQVSITRSRTTGSLASNTATLSTRPRPLCIQYRS
jgi:hypothetical protein